MAVQTHIGGETPTNGAAETIAMTMPYIATVLVEGKSAFLFHRYNCESVGEKAAAAKGSKAKKTDDVESYVYRTQSGNLAIPGEYLRMAVVNAARFRQDPRSPRKSAMDLFKAGVLPLTDLVDVGKAQWDYLDIRRAVVQRAAISRVRPALLPGWRANFELMVTLPEYITPQLLLEVIQDAGRLVGLGDFRPTYGRFNVISFAVR